jgi:predicted AAA+ superfamily ATPase
MLLERLHLYFLVGGMPQALAVYLQDHSLLEVSRVHESLMHSYREDINKYRQRLDVEGIERLLETIPAQAGKQVKYEHLAPDWRIERTKRALHLLERILLVSRTQACGAASLPLGADVHERRFKYVFLDVGLMRHQCGLPADAVLGSRDLLDVLRGSLAEQFVGQELLAREGSEQGRLYYWERLKPTSMAEVDYLVARNGVIHPIEVKSGTAGRLRSLKAFHDEHPRSGEGLVLSSRNVMKDGKNSIRFLPLYARL